MIVLLVIGRKDYVYAIQVCHVTIDHPLAYGSKIDLSY